VPSHVTSRLPPAPSYQKDTAQRLGVEDKCHRPYSMAYRGYQPRLGAANASCRRGGAIPNCCQTFVFLHSFMRSPHIPTDLLWPRGSVAMGFCQKIFFRQIICVEGGGPDPPPTKLSLHFGSTWSRHGGGGPALGPLPGMRAGDVEERQIPPTYPGAKPPDAFLARCEERREWLFRGTKVKSPGAFRSTSSRARIYRE